MNSSGSIYIGMDHGKPEICKIGMTTRNVNERFSQTVNPDYDLYREYKLQNESPIKLERHIHKLLVNKGFKRKLHKMTQKPSEWFECAPEVADEIISKELLKRKTKIEEEKARKLKVKREQEQKERLIQQKIDEDNKRAGLLRAFHNQYSYRIKELEETKDNIESLKSIELISLEKKYSKRLISFPGLLISLWFNMGIGAVITLMCLNFFNIAIDSIFGHVIIYSWLGFIIYRTATDPKAFPIEYDKEAIEKALGEWCDQQPDFNELDALNNYISYLNTFDIKTKPKPFRYPDEKLSEATKVSAETKHTDEIFCPPDITEKLVRSKDQHSNNLVELRSFPTPEGYIPLAAFSKEKGISEEKLIEMIRDGFYSGRKVDDQWFLLCQEKKDTNLSESTKSSGYKFRLWHLFVVIAILQVFAFIGRGS